MAHHQERGLISLTLTGWALVALSVALGVTFIYARVQTARLDRANEKLAVVTSQFAAFKLGVEEAGKKAELAKIAEAARLKKENADATKRWNARVAAANARADELCKRAGLSAGCRDLPAIPDTARPPDDAARDQRLLEVLRHAQGEVDRLLEFQEWQRRITQP